MRELDESVTLRRALAPDSDSVVYQGRVVHVASYATKFLFTSEQLNQPVERLSGGERARVLIAKLMLEPADVLLLDEPTNDLDIATLEILEESLLEYTGALVLVTHDRYMLDRVSTIVLGLDGQGNAETFADYCQWEQWQREQGSANSDGSSPDATATPAQKGPSSAATGSPARSAASYFLAAAAITGGRITVEGLGTSSIQGDVRFVDLLEQMGAKVEREPDRLTVTGTGELHGIEVDMADISDTAQTLAAVAAFADSPTVVRGIGFIRGKETDRIAAIVTELQRAGLQATNDEDGFTIVPGPLRPTRFQTYDDHRMAMSLALVGLRQPGIEIEDPGCVAKTYPNFFDDLAQLA